MDEQPTTEADLQETQALDAQPVEQPAEAEQTPDSEPQQEEQEESEAPAETDNADDLTTWAQSKGIDLSTSEGQQKALKSWREAEQAFSRKAQEASQLKKSIGDQPAGDDESWRRRIELSMQVNDWKDAKGISSEQDRLMGEYLTNNPQKNLALQYGVLTLDDVYAMSGAATMGLDPAAIKSQGGKEALQQLANKQSATAPRGNASSNTMPAGVTKANVDSWWTGLGPQGRADPANRAKLDSILSS